MRFAVCVVGARQLHKSRVTLLNIYNGTGQWQSFEEAADVVMLYSADGHRSDAGQNLPRDVCLDGQRDVAEVDVRIVCVGVEKCQVDALLTQRLVGVFVDISEDADLVNDRPDDVSAKEKNCFNTQSQDTNK